MPVAGRSTFLDLRRDVPPRVPPRQVPSALRLPSAQPLAWRAGSGAAKPLRQRSRLLGVGHPCSWRPLAVPEEQAPSRGKSSASHRADERLGNEPLRKLVPELADTQSEREIQIWLRNLRRELQSTWAQIRKCSNLWVSVCDNRPAVTRLLLQGSAMRRAAKIALHTYLPACFY